MLIAFIDDDDGPARSRIVQTPGEAADAGADPATGLPVPAPGNVPIDPLQIVLAVDRGDATRAADPRARRRTDVAVLGRWLAANHHPSTKLVLAAPGARWRYTAAMAPARASLTLRTKLTRATPPRTGGLRRLILLISSVPRQGAPPGSLIRVRPTRTGSSDPRVGDQRVVYVNTERRNALAAAAARAVMSISGQRER